MEVLVIVAGMDEEAASGQRGLHWAVELASETDMDRPWAVRVASYSVAPGTHHGGGETRVAELASRGEITETHGWEILPLIDRAGAVHVCRPHTRAGELAVLSARLLGKRLLVSDLTVRTSDLGRSFGLIQLADVVVCSSEDERREATGHHTVERVDLLAEGWMTRISELFGDEIAKAGSDR